MQPEYFEPLPEELRNLIRDTEQAMGFSVDVVPAPEQAPGAPGDPEDPLACEVGRDYARILVPAAGPLRPPSVYHEMMHIRRFLVEGAPVLVDCEDYEPWTPAIGTALTKHDNAFEHLIIVPRELQAFPENRTHWEAVMERCWSDIRAGQGDEASRRQLGLACWVFLQLVLPDSPTVQVAHEALLASERVEAAERFRAALIPVLGDKEAAMRIWFEHQQIPLEMASLRYFRPAEFRAWEVPLA